MVTVTWRWILPVALAAGLAGCAELNSLARDLEPLIATTGQMDENRIIAGLKEALEVGAGNAVVDLSRVDAYYRNPVLRIPLPEDVQMAGDLLRGVGLGALVDDFEHSLNSAAEQAAPQAKALFLGAIRDMTFADARRILEGPDTAATEYLRGKTQAPLGQAFRPIVARAMNEVGVTRLYRQMADSLRRIPLAPALAVDLDGYVTGKALDGLFLTVAEEEKKIRTNPAARVTELLREVFGKRRG